MKYNSIKEAISQIRSGKIIILVDDVERENEGDLMMAAEFTSAEHVNFMIRQGRGLVCQTITSTRAKELNLELQTNNNTSLHNTKFTVSVDALHGTSTGISAFDRATTIQCLVNSNTRSDDLGRPGHIFPIIADDGGVLVRRGHTEASIELSKLAGLKPNAIICEILNDEGRAANQKDLFKLAKKFNLAIVDINDLVIYLKGEKNG